MGIDNKQWSFPEYVHGKELTPQRTWHQGWSGVGAIIGASALKGKNVFRIGSRHE